MKNILLTVAFFILLSTILKSQPFDGATSTYSGIIHRTGSVGIGTNNSPNGKLHVNGDFILSRNNGGFVFSQGYQNNEHFLAIAPNASGTYSTDWDWSKALGIDGWTGELTKSVSNTSDMAFSVQVGSSKNFTVMGDGTTYAPKIRTGRIVTLNNADLSFLANTNQSESQIVTFLNNGKVVIGNVTTPGTYKLYVQTGILTEKVKVALTSSSDWADFVFDNAYKLRSISSLQEFITENDHLPDMPSGSELYLSGGVDVLEMFKLQQQKIEELTLYIIQLNNQIENLKSE